MCSKERSNPEDQVFEEIPAEGKEKPEQPQQNEAVPEENASQSGEARQTEGTDEKDARIAQLEAQLEEAAQRERDTVLRARAETDNIRRRAEQDIEKAHKFALEKFSGELLPVIDSLERALELTNKDDPAMAPMREGIELTLKSLLNAVRKFGIDVVMETNVPFNPDLHQAMTIVESPDHESNRVIDVMQKGYTLNGRLLRPAMVIVSK